MELEQITNKETYFPGEPVADFNPQMVDDGTNDSKKQKLDDAYYTASLNGNETNPISQIFESIEQEYQTTGYSNLVLQTKARLKEDNDVQQKAVVTGIIEDVTVPREEKEAVLQNYIYGYKAKPTLKSKYVQELSQLELETTPEDEILDYEMTLDKEFIMSKSIEIGENIQQQLFKMKTNSPEINLEDTNPARILKGLSTLQPGFTKFLDMTDVELERDNGFFMSTAVNVLQLVDALVVELLPYMTELGTTIAIAGEKSARGTSLGIPSDVLGELLLTNDEEIMATKNWTEIRDYTRNKYNTDPVGMFGWDGKYIPDLDYKDVGIVGDVALNARDLLQYILRVGGLAGTKEEYKDFMSQESSVVSAFTKLDEWFQWAAEHITPEDPGKSKVFLEIGAFFAFYGAKKGTQLAIQTKRRSSFKDAGYDSTVADLFAEIDKVKLDPIPLVETLGQASKSIPRIESKATDLLNSRVLDNRISPGSPMMTTLVVNKKAANKIIKEAIDDGSGKVAETVGTTRTKLIDLAFVPSLSLLTKPRHMDGVEFAKNKLLYDSLGPEYFNHAGFLFSEERKSWIKETDNVLDQTTAGIDLYQRNSDSLFMTTTEGLDASIAFSKTPESNFTSVNQVVTAAEVISSKVQETGLKDFNIVIEQLNKIDGVVQSFTIDSVKTSSLFKKPVNSVESLTSTINALRSQQKTSRQLLLNNKDLAFEASIKNVSVKEYKKVLQNRIKGREVEIQAVFKELQMAETFSSNKMMAPNFRIRVLRKSNWFDVGQAITDGFNKPPKRGWWGTKALFNSDAWNWLVQFGSKNKKLEESMHGAGLRSQAWLKNHLQDIQKKISKLDQAERGDMKVLFMRQLDVADVFTIRQIRDSLRPNLETALAEKYQSILYDARALDKYRFNAENLFELGRVRDLGYTESFKAEIMVDGKPEIRNIIAKDDFILDLDSNPRLIYDFANDVSIVNEFRTTHTTKEKRTFYENTPEGLKDTGLKIYRLAKNFEDSSGRIYEYGIFRNQQPQALPQRILPVRLGHMPAIMTGTKFVRSYPIEVVVNGKVTSFAQQFKDGTFVEGNKNFKAGEFADYLSRMSPYKRAVMMANSELNAKRWMENNPSYMDKTKNYYRIEDANEIKSLDRVEAQEIRENAMAASQLRSEKKIENAEYMDVFSSFVLTTESNGSRAFMAPVLAEYKLRWMKEYNDKGLVNIEGSKQSISGVPEPTAYPGMAKYIKPKEGLENVHKQAVKEWEQIAVLDQGFENNWIARGISTASGAIAKYTDKPIGKIKENPMENFIQKQIVERGYRWQKKPTALQNVPSRVTSQLKIQWQFPMWHWLIQTANSWGHLAVAGYSGLNKQTLRNYYVTAGQSAAVISQMVLDTKSNAKNMQGIIDGLVWMEKQSSIMKSGEKVLDLTAADRALIIQNGLKTGFFHIADHTFAKNFWKQGPRELNSSKFTRTVDKTNDFVGRIGFEQGELMGRTNTWMASRLDWVQKNPGLNWRSTLALAEITAGARKLAGSMDSFGEMRIQRVPILATFAQFSSFIMKSGEAMWNQSATPFNPKQMAALSAWNFGVYGIRGGMWYGSWVMVKEILSLIYDENQIDDVMNEFDDVALVNLMMNGFGDIIMPTYDEEGNFLRSDLEFNLRMSPMGADMPFGGYGQMYNFLMKDGFGNESFGPSGALLKDIWGEHGVWDMMQAIWSSSYNDKDTADKVMASAKVLSKLSGLTSGMLRYKIALSINDKMTKQGQVTGEGMTNSEKLLWGWSSVSSESERLQFEYFEKNKSYKEKVESDVKEAYTGLIAIYGESPNVYQLAEYARSLKYALEGSDYMDEKYYEDFWSGLISYQDRAETSRLENIFQKAIKNYQPEVRVSTAQLSEMRTLLKAFEVKGKNHPNYQSLLHVVTIMENGRREVSEKEMLKYRKEQFDKGGTM